jgi:hypothetical protein
MSERRDRCFFSAHVQPHFLTSTPGPVDAIKLNAWRSSALTVVAGISKLLRAACADSSFRRIREDRATTHLAS